MSDKDILNNEEMPDVENDLDIENADAMSDGIEPAPEIDDTKDDMDLDLDLSDLGGDGSFEFQSMEQSMNDGFDDFLSAETSGFASGFPDWDLLPPER